eukprot:gnl/MRDRNA2_/MRDRNA2_242405_c0_seq1.p1 gnl/MRDRNA2_/MRDRNA2_242405_c0~~gnl/MRDRNA2_/MRDRNA2_242405_c0_seq1.p1  ORF type:complete len:104 (+),score=8.57 gnl/MRDRNA2_/MRDRNA2_242405_c0_seq1:383-694(+)
MSLAEQNEKSENWNTAALGLRLQLSQCNCDLLSILYLYLFCCLFLFILAFGKDHRVIESLLILQKRKRPTAQTTNFRAPSKCCMRIPCIKTNRSSHINTITSI